ncbi:hypothetical protein GGER_44350 [Serratia rubidaea]
MGGGLRDIFFQIVNRRIWRDSLKRRQRRQIHTPVRQLCRRQFRLQPAALAGDKLDILGILRLTVNIDINAVVAGRLPPAWVNRDRSAGTLIGLSISNARTLNSSRACACVGTLRATAISTANGVGRPSGPLTRGKAEHTLMVIPENLPSQP